MILTQLTVSAKRLQAAEKRWPRLLRVTLQSPESTDTFQWVTDVTD